MAYVHRKFYKMGNRIYMDGALQTRVVSLIYSDVGAEFEYYWLF